MMTRENARASAKFLDMQADIGVTKHIGGFEATHELLSLCHIEAAQEVLNVGSGIGVGSAYVAKKYRTTDANLYHWLKRHKLQDIREEY